MLFAVHERIRRVPFRLQAGGVGAPCTVLLGVWVKRLVVINAAPVFFSIGCSRKTCRHPPNTAALVPAASE